MPIAVDATITAGLVRRQRGRRAAEALRRCAKLSDRRLAFEFKPLFPRSRRFKWLPCCEWRVATAASPWEQSAATAFEESAL
jgi:hypothetical protein